MTSSSWRFGITVAFMILASLAAATVGAQPPVYLTQWGSGGSGDGQFNYPGGVATDAAGNVYVADRYNYRIQKFTGDGVYLTQWPSFGNTEADDVATDAAGNVYVACANSRHVQKFTSDGTFLTQWPSAVGAADVATDSAGNVYVTGSFGVEKYTSGGTLLTQWGTGGSGDGEFQYADGVAVDATGNVYVADTYNNRIQKFTSDGNYLTQWGSSGSGNGQFDRPYSVAVDVSANVYVADLNNHRIQKFTGDGTYLTKWGTPGAGNGQFQYPGEVAVDAAGNVFVGDLSNARIQKFGPGPPGPVTCDLILTQSDSSDPVTVGQSFNYYLVVRNAGPWDAEDVFVRNPVPPTTTLQYVFSSRGFCYDSSGTVVCNLGSVPASDSAAALITIGLYANSPGTIENVANAVTSTFDTDVANNTAAESTTVQQLQDADVFVSQRHAPDPAVTGGNVAFTVTVGNHGPSNATDAQMFFSTYGSADSIASVSSDRGSCVRDTVGCCVSCQLGTLAPGDSARIVVGIIPLEEGTITSYAFAGSSVQDHDFSNNNSYDFVPVLFSAEQRINGLIALIGSFRLKAGNQRNLVGPLQDALAALAARDTSGACGAIDAFRRKVGKLAGRGLTLTQAFALDYEADQIQARLACSTRPGAAAARLGPEIQPFSFRLRSILGSAAQADLALPAAGRVRLDVYDVSGRRVRTALDGELAAGAHVVDWDGRGSEGGRAPAGVYFLRVAAGGEGAVARFVLLR